MNKKNIKKQENKIQRQYHIPGCSKIYPRKRNAIFISPSNSKAHELKKCEICYELREKGYSFITEAVCNKTGNRRDVVDITNDVICEIETTTLRAQRFLNDEYSGKMVVYIWNKKTEKWEKNFIQKKSFKLIKI